LYQWGRKNPFIGASRTSESTFVASTGIWGIAEGGNYYTIEDNPTTFYKNMSLDDSSWNSTKTIYDPCPVGWRVPDGGDDGVWSKALGSSSAVSWSNMGGANLSGALGDDQTIWYPATGYLRYFEGGLLGVGQNVHCWSVSYFDDYTYGLSIVAGRYDPLFNVLNRANGYSVRCQKENK
jgi:hypothetical protein